MLDLKDDPIIGTERGDSIGPSAEPDQGARPKTNSKPPTDPLGNLGLRKA